MAYLTFQGRNWSVWKNAGTFLVEVLIHLIVEFVFHVERNGVFRLVQLQLIKTVVKILTETFFMKIMQAENWSTTFILIKLLLVIAMAIVMPLVWDI